MFGRGVNSSYIFRKGFCFHYVFKTNFPGHKKFWGITPECLPWLRADQSWEKWRRRFSLCRMHTEQCRSAKTKLACHYDIHCLVVSAETRTTCLHSKPLSTEALSDRSAEQRIGRLLHPTSRPSAPAHHQDPFAAPPLTSSRRNPIKYCPCQLDLIKRACFFRLRAWATLWVVSLTFSAYSAV